ncbi:hypothetical protein Nans01_18150 [Nocardiopsis ansamitocini]|uniref:Uncharacterized protein n=1 Tax=Nocardiopsis ansamitocini TaxID=1670832 RepID=A0A9W6UI96_9ACTN|nr:hypothetical protein Nans01_18150 [Nocardiopsis ansamitocini]
MDGGVFDTRSHHAAGPFAEWGTGGVTGPVERGPIVRGTLIPRRAALNRPVRRDWENTGFSVREARVAPAANSRYSSNYGMNSEKTM